MRAKYELLEWDGVLSFEYDTAAKFSEIGGMQRLRHWLEVRREFFLEDNDMQLDPRRGASCSWECKAAGKASWPRPPLRFSTLPCSAWILACFTTKYYGETERNLRKALETAEVMARCEDFLDG